MVPCVVAEDEEEELFSDVGEADGLDAVAQRQKSVSTLNATICALGVIERCDSVTVSSVVIKGRRLDRFEEMDKRESDEVDGLDVGRGGNAAVALLTLADTDLRGYAGGGGKSAN